MRIRGRGADHRLRRENGFSLIEVLIGMVILGIAVLGLAQLFVMSIANNKRGGEIGQATFLAQQQVDYLRNLTAVEINGFPSAARGETADEQININGDETVDFRRLTQVQANGFTFGIKILVFPASQLGVPAADLLQNPYAYRVRAIMNTIITR